MTTARAQAQTKQLKADRDILYSALVDLTNNIEDLIGDSTGVAGLHLNGEVAHWASLRVGGEFSSWLESLDHALAVVDEMEGRPM